jgi:hypothetical protein
MIHDDTREHDIMTQGISSVDLYECGKGDMPRWKISNNVPSAEMLNEHEGESEEKTAGI